VKAGGRKSVVSGEKVLIDVPEIRLIGHRRMRIPLP
jgi:hypothetical protein